MGKAGGTETVGGVTGFPPESQVDYLVQIEEILQIFYLCFIDQETDSEKGCDEPKLIEVVKCIAEF